MTRASDIKARMRSTTLREQRAPEASQAVQAAQASGASLDEVPALATPEQKPAARERRIRYTLDLSPAQHRFLKRFAFEAEVDASIVVRALLTELERDPQLAARVHAQVMRSEE